MKLPRVPVADNITTGEMPMFRNLWDHIGKKMPKKGRGKGDALDPMDLPVQLQTALQALYGHYEKTFELWEKAGAQPATHLSERPALDGMGACDCPIQAHRLVSFACLA